MVEATGGQSLPWENYPGTKCFFANINSGSISDQWTQKPGDAVNPTELAIAAKLCPDKPFGS